MSDNDTIATLYSKQNEKKYRQQLSIAHVYTKSF